MKLTEISVKNFVLFDEAKIIIGDKVTRLIGANGTGKTTIINGFWSAIKGISERPKEGQLYGERYRFLKNPEKSSTALIRLYDEILKTEIIIQNTITNNNNSIVITSSDGRKLDQSFCDNLLNTLFLSSDMFNSLDSQQQAKAIGIDLKEIDKKILEVKRNITEQKKTTIRFEDMANKIAIEKHEQKCEKETLSKISTLDEENKKVEQAEKELAKKENEVILLKEKLRTNNGSIQSKKDRINKLKEEISECEMDILTLSEINLVVENQLNQYLEEVSIANIPEKQKMDVLYTELSAIRDNNKNALKYLEYQKRLEDVQLERKKLAELNDRKDNLLQERNEQMKEFSEIGIDVNEDGILTYQGKPIKKNYFSTGEYERIVTDLFILSNPQLKVRFLQNYSMLDEKNQTEIVNDLLKKGFQVITEEVSEQSEMIVISGEKNE